MKAKNLFSILVVLTVLYFNSYGCNNNPVNSSSRRYTAMTELDFQNNDLRARPGSVIVVELEDLNSPPDSVFDTDMIGTDAIPIEYTETAEHSFRLDEASILDNSATAYEMTLVNANTKEELFTINNVLSHITRSIPAGNYVMVFKSNRPYGSSETGNQVIFVQPDRPGTGNTDYDEEQLKHFISTRECNGCNLSNANLSHRELYNVSLINANLDGAKFEFTEFMKSNVHGASFNLASFSYSEFDSSDFSNTNFTGSSIISTHFSASNFTGANFSSATLRGSDFLNTDFTSANFYDAELSDAVFDYTMKLIGVNMRHANLMGAKFTNVDISGSDFSFSNMTYVTFNTVNARGVNFCGALKDRINARMVFTNEHTTCWP